MAYIWSGKCLIAIPRLSGTLSSMNGGGIDATTIMMLLRSAICEGKNRGPCAFESNDPQCVRIKEISDGNGAK